MYFPMPPPSVSETEVSYKPEITWHPTSENSNRRFFGSAFKTATKYSWIVSGQQLAVFTTDGGNQLSLWKFGEKRYYPNKTRIECVEEFPCINMNTSVYPNLLVGTSYQGSGQVVFYNATRKVLRAYGFPSQVTAISLIDDGFTLPAAYNLLPQPFLEMSGVVAVGRQDARITILHLNIKSIAKASRKLEFEKNEQNTCTMKSIDLMDDAVAIEEIIKCTNEDQSAYYDVCFPKAKGGVTALYYSKEAVCLFIGFECGAIFIFGLDSLTVLHCFPAAHGAIFKFAQLEPCEDPRNSIWIWATHKPNPIGIPASSMHCVSFFYKRFVDGYGQHYKRFREGHTSFVLSPTAKGSLACSNSRLLSCDSYSRLSSYTSTGITYDNQALFPKSLACCTFSCYRQMKDETWLVMFDIDQWYKAQMPFVGTVTCSYLTLKLLRNTPLVGTFILPKSIRGPVAKTYSDSHFFPQSLDFTVIGYQENSLYKMSCSGLHTLFRKRVIQLGHMGLIEPEELFRTARKLDIVCAFEEPPANNSTAALKREYLIKLYFEHSFTSVIKEALQKWLTTPYSRQECTFMTLSDVIWDYIQKLWRTARELFKPLFIAAEEPFNNEDKSKVLHLFRIWHNIATVMSDIEKMSRKPETALGEKEAVFVVFDRMIFYINMVVSFMQRGLLPEVESASFPDTIPYDYEAILKHITLRKQYLEKRWRVDSYLDIIKLPKSGFYLADCMLYPHKNIIKKLWSFDGGDGCYPPKSIQSLLRLCLCNEIPVVDTQKIISYFLIDVESTLEDNKKSHLLKQLDGEYSVACPLKVGVSDLSAVMRSFWNIDHTNFKVAIDVLRTITNQSFSSEREHRVIAVILFLEKQFSLAFKFVDGGFLQHSLFKARARVILLLILRCNTLAHMYVQDQKLYRDELLEVFFDVGTRLYNFKPQILSLHLDEYEYRYLEKFLRRQNTNQANELLIKTLLVQKKFIEAKVVHERMPLAVRSRENAICLKLAFKALGTIGTEYEQEKYDYEQSHSNEPPCKKQKIVRLTERVCFDEAGNMKYKGGFLQNVLECAATLRDPEEQSVPEKNAGADVDDDDWFDLPIPTAQPRQLYRGIDIYRLLDVFFVDEHSIAMQNMQPKVSSILKGPAPPRVIEDENITCRKNLRFKFSSTLSPRSNISEPEVENLVNTKSLAIPKIFCIDISSEPDDVHGNKTVQTETTELLSTQPQLPLTHVINLTTDGDDKKFNKQTEEVDLTVDESSEKQTDNLKHSPIIMHFPSDSRWCIPQRAQNEQRPADTPQRPRHQQRAPDSPERSPGPPEQSPDPSELSLDPLGRLSPPCSLERSPNSLPRSPDSERSLKLSISDDGPCSPPVSLHSEDSISTVDMQHESTGRDDHLNQDVEINQNIEVELSDSDDHVEVEDDSNSRPPSYTRMEDSDDEYDRRAFNELLDGPAGRIRLRYSLPSSSSSNENSIILLSSNNSSGGESNKREFSYPDNRSESSEESGHMYDNATISRSPTHQAPSDESTMPSLTDESDDDASTLSSGIDVSYGNIFKSSENKVQEVLAGVKIELVTTDGHDPKNDDKDEPIGKILTASDIEDIGEESYNLDTDRKAKRKELTVSDLEDIDEEPPYNLETDEKVKGKELSDSDLEDQDVPPFDLDADNDDIYIQDMLLESAFADKIIELSDSLSEAIDEPKMEAGTSGLPANNICEPDSAIPFIQEPDQTQTDNPFLPSSSKHDIIVTKDVTVGIPDTTESDIIAPTELIAPSTSAPCEVENDIIVGIADTTDEQLVAKEDNIDTTVSSSLTFPTDEFDPDEVKIDPNVGSAQDINSNAASPSPSSTKADIIPKVEPSSISEEANRPEELIQPGPSRSTYGMVAAKESVTTAYANVEPSSITGEANTPEELIRPGPSRSTYGMVAAKESVTTAYANVEPSSITGEANTPEELIRPGPSRSTYGMVAAKESINTAYANVEPSSITGEANTPEELIQSGPCKITYGMVAAKESVITADVKEEPSSITEEANRPEELIQPGPSRSTYGMVAAKESVTTAYANVEPSSITGEANTPEELIQSGPCKITYGMVAAKESVITADVKEEPSSITEEANRPEELIQPGPSRSTYGMVAAKESVTTAYANVEPSSITGEANTPEELIRPGPSRSTYGMVAAKESVTIADVKEEPSSITEETNRPEELIRPGPCISTYGMVAAKESVTTADVKEEPSSITEEANRPEELIQPGPCISTYGMVAAKESVTTADGKEEPSSITEEANRPEELIQPGPCRSIYGMVAAKNSVTTAYDTPTSSKLTPAEESVLESEFDVAFIDYESGPKLNSPIEVSDDTDDIVQEITPAKKSVKKGAKKVEAVSVSTRKTRRSLSVDEKCVEVAKKTKNVRRALSLELDDEVTAKTRKISQSTTVEKTSEAEPAQQPQRRRSLRLSSSKINVSRDDTEIKIIDDDEEEEGSTGKSRSMDSLNLVALQSSPFLPKRKRTRTLSVDSESDGYSSDASVQSEPHVRKSKRKTKPTLEPIAEESSPPSSKYKKLSFIKHSKTSTKGFREMAKSIVRRSSAIGPQQQTSSSLKVFCPPSASTSAEYTKLVVDDTPVKGKILRSGRVIDDFSPNRPSDQTDIVAQYSKYRRLTRNSLRHTGSSPNLQQDATTPKTKSSKSSKGK